MKFPKIEEVDAANKLQLAKWIVGLGDMRDELPATPIEDRIYFRFYIELNGWTPKLKKDVGAGAEFDAVMHLN